MRSEKATPRMGQKNNKKKTQQRKNKKRKNTRVRRIYDTYIIFITPRVLRLRFNMPVQVVQNSSRVV